MQNNQVVVFNPTTDTALSVAVMGLRSVLEEAARRQVLAQVEGQDFTQAEIHAMTVVEALKKVNGIDLASLYMRYELVTRIEQEALWTIHPAHYESRDQMARDQGISPSELSDIMSLVGVIFPYLEGLGLNIATVWESIGKSNFRELTPVLKYIITGEFPERPNQSSQAAEAFLNDVAATAAAAGQVMAEADIAREAVEQLIELGSLPNRQLRQHIRPDRTDPIEALYVTISGRRFMVAEVSEDQETLVQRRLGQYIEPVRWNAPQDRRQRRSEAPRLPVLGAILRELED